ncbi:MAG: hypothetical protein GYA24_11730 [Candidatus Lokiarchaeota archaeon]|nr:hypothetical protein [Candidatus Lokiarchaeota archaeon]
MLLELPPGTPAIYYHEINFIVEVISIITFFVVAGILFVRKEGELDIARRIKIGYAFFTIFYAMCRIFFIVAVWYPDETWSTDSYDFFVVIGYFFACVGLTAMILVIEKYLITKTRHVFTIIGIVMCVVYFLSILGILTQHVALLLSYVSSPLLTVVMVALYLYLAVKGAAELRRKAIAILVAIALIGVSAIVDGESMVINAGALLSGQDLILDLYYSIPPVILMIGILIFLKNTY